MRILVIANNDVGLYKFRRELLEELLKNNEVYISLPNGEFVPEMEKMGCVFKPCEFDRRGTNPIRELKLISRYKKLLKEVRPDVVLTYTIKPNVYGGIACRSRKIPYLANVTGLGTSIENGGLLAFITKTLYKIGLKKASCVFFQNSANMQLFTEKKIVKGKTRLIPGSGVNLERHCLEEYPEDTGTTKFLFIGRIMRDKGIDELLDAMRVVRKDYPAAELDIIGAFDENDSGTIGDAEKEGLIRYHGKQSDVHPFIKAANCTVLPSYHEGIANVLLESASTGRPVIATRVPGCRETFEEGVTGLGCDVKNAESLADAMKAFIALDHETKKQMGIAGRRKVEREFDRNLVINAYLEEIHSI